MPRTKAKSSAGRTKTGLLAGWCEEEEETPPFDVGATGPTAKKARVTRGAGVQAQKNAPANVQDLVAAAHRQQMEERVIEAERRAAEAEALARRTFETRARSAEELCKKLEAALEATKREQQARVEKLRRECETRTVRVRRECQNRVSGERRVCEERLRAAIADHDAAVKSMRQDHDKVASDLVSTWKESMKLTRRLPDSEGAQQRDLFRQRIRERGFEATSSPIHDEFYEAGDETEQATCT